SSVGDGSERGPHGNVTCGHKVSAEADGDRLCQPPDCASRAASSACRSGLSAASWAGSVFEWPPLKPWSAVPLASAASRSGDSAASCAGSSLYCGVAAALLSVVGGEVVAVVSCASAAPTNDAPIAPPAR